MAKALKDADIPFGGIAVVAFGDFDQFPPIADTPLYTGVGHGASLHDAINAFTRGLFCCIRRFQI